MSDLRPIRFAIAGMGRWGVRAHLPALAGRPDVVIAACVDPRVDETRPIAHRHGIRHVFEDIEALFDSGADLDAVILATPTDTHRDLCLAVLRAGVHVLCEKPLAHDSRQAREITAAAESRGVMTKMGFLFRASPVIQRMKELVDAGYVGEVQLVESIAVNGQFIDPQQPLNWKMQRARAHGGAFVEYGSHSVDLALWFGGPIARVVAHGATLIRSRPSGSGERRMVDVDDASSWIAVYEGGGDALFRTGWASLPVGGGGLRIYGSRGSLAWQLDPTTRRSEQLVAATVDQPRPHVLLEFAPPFDPRFDEGPYPIGLLARYNARLVDGFVNDIRAGRPSPPAFQEGLAVQHVLTAIRASLDENRWVDVHGEGQGTE